MGSIEKTIGVAKLGGRFDSSRKGNRSQFAALGMTDHGAKKKMSKQQRKDYLAREQAKSGTITPLSSMYS